MRTAPAALLVVLAGCGPEFELTPREGSSFGHYEVRAVSPKLETLDGTPSVTVGGIAAYDVVRDDARTVRFKVQGAPDPGAKEVVFATRKAQVTGAQFTYRPPVDPRFSRLVAFGASLTMGMQDGSLSIHTQTHGPAAQIAKAAGAYLPLPLVKDGFLPKITLDDYDPATCDFRDENIFDVVGQKALAEVLPKLKDSEGNIVIAKARVDPTLEVRDVAIGGFRLRQVLYGSADMMGAGFEHIVWDPLVDGAGLVEEPAQKMIDRVEALAPTVALCTDLFANDYNNVNLRADGVPDLNALTPLADFKPQLSELLTRLDGTGAEVFLATGPDVTVLPGYDVKVARLRAAGFSEADATSWRQAMRQRIIDYNTELLAQAAGHPRVHVVDLFTKVGEAFANGLDVGGTHLSPKPLGGLTSLDGLHFSDTGYAVLANEYIAALNATLGTRVPEIDVAGVLADDANSVAKLREAGFACAGN